MSILLVTLIALSLSMDAFSLSLLYGTLKMDKNSKIKLASIVGLFHFIMPILGNLVGNTIIKILPIKANIIVFMILFFIGIEMIIESFKENSKTNYLDILGMILFAFAVSLDSFTTGLCLDIIYKNKLVSVILFSSFSFLFTYLGLYLGEYINNKAGKISTFFGGFILIIISILYII